jgi:cell wall-associated NlpC family hydrolase
LRTAHTLLRTLIVGAVAVAIVVPASVAMAAPSVSDLQQQINQSSNKLEHIVEQYNKVTGDLQASKAAETKLQKQMQPLQTQVDAASKTIGAIATAAYKSGGLGKVGALLTAGSPQDLVEQLSALDQIGRSQHAQVSGYQRAAAKYTSEKKLLDGNLAAQQAQQTSLAAQRTKINGDIKNLTAMRVKAYGVGSETPKKSTVVAPYFPGPAGVAVKYAFSKLGYKYVYATAGPNTFDCSGLTMAAWKAAGVTLPHNAAEQWDTVSHISRSQLKAGDLVFYHDLDHVAIYVGSSQIIEAPQTNELVKEVSVDYEKPYGYGRPHS